MEACDLVSALFEARSAGRVLAAPVEAAVSLDEALGLQLEILQRFAAAGEPLGGWKVGLTSGPSRDAMGKDFRPFGYLLRSRVRSSGSKIPLGIPALTVEPEICLVMGAALRGDKVDPATAKRALRAVAPAFEVNEIRVPRTSSREIILADGLANWGIVIGEEAPVPDDLSLTTVDLYEAKRRILTVQPGATMDDPYLSLSRLCATLHKFGLGLEPDQRVITGAFCQHPVSSPTLLRASFSGIGDVEARICTSSQPDII